VKNERRGRREEGGRMKEEEGGVRKKEETRKRKRKSPSSQCEWAEHANSFSRE
jgi:hypothetical protein